MGTTLICGSVLRLHLMADQALEDVYGLIRLRSLYKHAIHSRSTAFTPQPDFVKAGPSGLPGVRNRDGVRRDRAGGEHLAALFDVDERRARRADGRAAARRRRRAGEGDGAKVGEGDERAAGLEVLDDPLRVVLAERRLARERVRHGLALRLVRDRRRAAGLRGRCDGHGDGVARGEGDTGEVVRVVGVPLVPGCQCQAQSGVSSLQLSGGD